MTAPLALLAPPPAHLGHWYHSLLYLAPVLIVVVVLWVQERRERRHGGEGDE